jgi:hypothetical protein
VEKKVAPPAGWGYVLNMTTTKEKTRVVVKTEAGVLKLTPQMELVLAQQPEWVEYYEEKKRDGKPLRLPVFYRGTDAKWWWLGLRAVYLAKGAARVSIWGRQRMAQCESLPVVGRGSIDAWVVDDSPALSPGIYSAPWPLETPEDAKRYVDAGIEMTCSAAHCARFLGWKGSDAIQTVEKFRNIVLRLWTGQDVSKLRHYLDNIKIPGRHEHVTRRMDWDELAEFVTGQAAQIEAMAGELAETKKHVGTLTRKLEAAERYNAETKRRHAAEIETLRGEMSRLADLLI